MMQAACMPVGEFQSHVDGGQVNFQKIIARGAPFTPAQRISVTEDIDLRKEVERICVDQGKPLILEGFHRLPEWRQDLFTFSFLEKTHGNDGIVCRDLRMAEDVPTSMSEYIQKVHSESSHPSPILSPTVARETSYFSPPLTQTRGDNGSVVDPSHMLDHSSSPNGVAPSSELLYAKDLTCPPRWRAFLDQFLPNWLSSMGENDLLRHVKAHLAAENMLVYIGQGGTWTPAHIDQCGAIGHNIMPWADNEASSIWFLVSTEDKAKAEALWASFGHPLEYEAYFASVEELSRATFPIYVVEQKVGDFVLVPSQSYHQVFNLGKASIKVAWNRLTSQSLKASVDSVLPRYREIGRPEGYRIGIVIKSTIEAFRDILQSQTSDLGLPPEDFIESFNTLLNLFRTIIEEEWVDMSPIDSRGSFAFKKPKRLTNTSPATCDYCRADLWNRQYQCNLCKNEDGDSYDICARCVSLGRGCIHRATRQLEFVENFSMRSCIELHNEAVDAWNQSEVLEEHPNFSFIENPWENGYIPLSDKGFSYATLAYKRKSTLKRRRKACHQCDQKNKNYMIVGCSDCSNRFCEVCLYEFYEIQWNEIEASRQDWICPVCMEYCCCKTCGGPEERTQEKSRSKSTLNLPLVFTNPDDDDRNCGGVSDGIRKDFVDDEQPPTIAKQEPADECKIDLGHNEATDVGIESSQTSKMTTLIERGMPSPIQEADQGHGVSEMDTEEFQLPTAEESVNVFGPEFKEMLDFLYNSKFHKTLEALEQSNGESALRTKIYKTDRLLASVGLDVQKIFRSEVSERVLDARTAKQVSRSPTPLTLPSTSKPKSTPSSRSVSKSHLGSEAKPITIEDTTLQSQTTASSSSTTRRRPSTVTPSKKTPLQKRSQRSRNESDDIEYSPPVKGPPMQAIREATSPRKGSKRKSAMTDDESRLDEVDQKAKKRSRTTPEPTAEDQAEKRTPRQRRDSTSTQQRSRPSSSRMSEAKDGDGRDSRSQKNPHPSFVADYEFTFGDKVQLPPIPLRTRGRPRKQILKESSAEGVSSMSPKQVKEHDDDPCQEDDQLMSAQVSTQEYGTTPGERSEVVSTQDTDPPTLSIDLSQTPARDMNHIPIQGSSSGSSTSVNGDGGGSSQNPSMPQVETPRRRHGPLRIERTRYIEISIGPLLAKAEESEPVIPIFPPPAMDRQDSKEESTEGSMEVEQIAAGEGSSMDSNGSMMMEDQTKENTSLLSIADDDVDMDKISVASEPCRLDHDVVMEKGVRPSSTERRPSPTRTTSIRFKSINKRQPRTPLNESTKPSAYPLRRRTSSDRNSSASAGGSAR